MMEEDYKLAKWLNNELTETELAEFKANSDYIKYEKIKNYSKRLKVKNADKIDDDKLLTIILSSKKQETKVVSFQKNWIFKIASVLLVGLGISYFSIINFVTKTEIAENGKQTTFSLPDNSEVVLNSGSEVEYKKWNWNNNRNLTLKGQAYFRVAKGKKFEVQTALGKVAVLGTQFDVKSEKNSFEVVCFEGRVKVNYKSKEAILTKGMKVTFENEKQINSTVLSNQPYWLTNTIIFNNKKLINIVKEIENQYKVTIELKCSDKKDFFNGGIPSNNIDEALHIITSMYKLKHYKTIDNKIVFEDE